MYLCFFLSGDLSAHGYEYYNVDKNASLYWSIGNSTKSIADALNVPVIVSIGKKPSSSNVDVIIVVCKREVFYF